MTTLAIDIVRVVSAPFDENCYLLHLPGRTDCLLVDPGTEPEAIIAAVDERGWTPAALVVTHGHGDHIAGLEATRQRWPEAPIVIGELEADKLTDPWKNLSAMFGLPVTAPPADILVADGASYSAAGFELEVRLTPGHSSGHVVYLWQGPDRTYVIGGDVLFAGSIGRTDFPGGSFEQLAAAIRQHLYTLPDDTLVLPGHGTVTTTGQEKRTNPFVRAEPA